MEVDLKGRTSAEGWNSALIEIAGTYVGPPHVVRGKNHAEVQMAFSRVLGNCWHGQSSVVVVGHNRNVREGFVHGRPQVVGQHPTRLD